jgi:hypothetical protein
MRTDVAVEQQRMQSIQRIDGTNKIRIREERVVEVNDPALLAAFTFNGGAAPGMTIASDDGPGTAAVNVTSTRIEFEKRSDLLAAKSQGLITGKEPWYRTEYMRLSQNERRASLRTKRHKRTKARRAHAR